MKKKAIICDLDGTLALIGQRNPYDLTEMSEDLLNEPIANVLSVYDNQNIFDVDILIVTGRSDEYRKETEEWLRRHKITNYKHLYMRKAGDNRKDTSIKKEIYNHHIKEKYDIVFVLEDRDQVVRMWRKELGLTCLQVEYGDF